MTLETPPPASKLMILLWAALCAVIIGIVGAGLVFLSGGRREPLPIIAEVPEFSLVAQDGRTMTRESFIGRPWVADFIFTRCVAICPRMTQQMRRLVDSLPEDFSVRIASISVDPEFDTPEVLTAYAEAHQVAGDWHFLTGDINEIEELTLRGFLMPLDRLSPGEIGAGQDPIIHSNRFVLVDGEARVRGYYDAFDPAELDRLRGDLRAVAGEH